jgi:hypothetical protein
MRRNGMRHEIFFLYPHWEYESEFPYVSGVWLTCAVHGHIEYYDVYEQLNLGVIIEEEERHFKNLHWE